MSQTPKLEAGYANKTVHIYIRLICLIILAGGLIYASFFIDKFLLTSDLKINTLSLQNDISYTKEVLESADIDYAILVKTIDTLSRANPKANENDFLRELSQVESRTSKVLEVLIATLNRVEGMYTVSNSPVAISLNQTIKSRFEQLHIDMSDVSKKKENLRSWRSHNEKVANAMAAKLGLLEETKYTDNIYLAMRALSLGALGALITLITVQLLVATEKKQPLDFIKSPHFWPFLLGHTLMGSIVSVVIFGLFYTKQLTIFQVDVTSKEVIEPEFWRVTMLCIIAGAFSEKLYGAASNRLDKYTEEDPKIPPSTAQPVPIQVPTENKPGK